MKRREFFTASAAAGLALGTSAAASAASNASGKEFYDLQIFRFDSPAKQQAFDQFLAEAAVPALNRAGVGPVGAFRLLKDDNPNLELAEDSPDLFVLLPHKSLESVATLVDRLGDDEVFQEAGQQILEAPKSDPAYLRFESSLLLAFDDIPKLEVPSKADTRILQLRIYESHSIQRHLKKVEMFNEGGEIAIFRRTGLNPVFFGQALVGSKLPNLTYMLSFDDIEAKEKAWAAFLADPGWDKLKKDETYKDTVSAITNLILHPAASSQI